MKCRLHDFGVLESEEFEGNKQACNKSVCEANIAFIRVQPPGE